MLEVPVKLIVKAPNQQIEDQTIQCCLTWTIKRLKGYLSEVYPSRPNTEDQRLIYYGQLLNDSVTLKDVFTRYEAGEEIHTVHLVCIPSKETLRMQARKIAEESNKKIKEVTSNGSSGSQQVVMSEDENIQNNAQETYDVAAEGTASSLSRSSASSTTSSIRGRYYFQPASYQNWMNMQSAGTDNHYLQQWTWMQQLYAHYYLTQYMDMMARQNGFREEYGAHGRQRDAARNAEAPAPRDIEDDDNRRDWLDYFCILSRLVVLLAILYFYSSPARFLIVSTLGVAVYLYQVGFFRINQLQAVENNNGVINNNNINVNNNNNMRVDDNNDNGDNDNEAERRENDVRDQRDSSVEAPERFLSPDDDTFVESNGTTADEVHWTPEDLTILVLYCCSSAIGAAANLFVIAAVAGSTARCRNTFVLSLCASDLLVCTVSMPLSVSTMLVRFWTMGVAFCKVSFYFQSLPVAASTTSLMMLALDRYVIVKHPRILSKLRPQQMITFAWSGAAFVTSPILYAREINFHQCKEIWPTDKLRTAYTLSHIAIVYVIPCLTVASCHFSVGHKLCATSHPSISLPLPLMRKPQHVIIVASVLPDSPSKVVPYGRSGDSSDEVIRSDYATKPRLAAGRQSNTKSTRSVFESTRKLKNVPPLVRQVSRQSLHSRRRLANMLVAMVLVFAVCWAPYVGLKISSVAGMHVPTSVLSFSLFLGHTHSAINPLVYYLSNKQSLANTLSCGCHWPWERNIESSGWRRPPPSSTNEAALGVFHPSYTTKRYQPNRGCTNDYL